MRTVFLDAGSLDRGDLDLAPVAEAADGLVCYDRTDPGDIAERIVEADCVIVNKVRLDAAAFAAAPRLRLVCVVATGVNNVDLDAARSHGVAVANCREYGVASVSQHVLMLLLALARSLPAYDHDVRAGRWREAPFFCLLDHPIRELGAMTLGVVGHGSLGRATAALCAAAGMTVQVAERRGASASRANRVPFEACLRTSDAVTLHCPLTPDTQGLIGERELALMPQGALLVNTARAGLVDDGALVRSLACGHLGGAAVDVLDEEPPRDPQPLLDAGLPNLIVTPHCAWGSLDARRRIVTQTAENMCGFLAGEPVRLVT